MARWTCLLICLGVCLAFAACPSGPSSSDSSSSAAGEAAVLERKVEHIEGLLAWRPVAAGVLDALLSALPDRVRLTEVSYDSGQIRIKGSAPSNNLLADYIAFLGESRSLANVSLGGSVMKTVRGRESWEFTLDATVREPEIEPVPAGAALAARLAELEESLPSRQDSAATLRELQRLALDAGLQMTAFAAGAETAGEFVDKIPVTIGVQGDRSDVAGYLRGLGSLSRLWVIDKLSLKGLSADDPRSDVRATITAAAYFPK